MNRVSNISRNRMPAATSSRSMVSRPVRSIQNEDSAPPATPPSSPPVAIMPYQRLPCSEVNDRVGQAPELFHQDDAEHVDENVEAEGDGLAGFAKTGKKGQQQRDNGRAGAQHHPNAGVAGDDAVIGGDD